MLGAPLILGKVKPNAVYGFRTPKTLSNDEIWYAANRTAGWDMVLAAVVCVCLWFARPYVPAMRGLSAIAFIALVQPLALAAFIAHSFWRLRQM